MVSHLRNFFTDVKLEQHSESVKNMSTWVSEIKNYDKNVQEEDLMKTMQEYEIFDEASLRHKKNSPY